MSSQIPDLQTLFVKFKQATGQCASNKTAEELKSSIELAQKRIDEVLFFGKIFQGETETIQKLAKASEGLGKVAEGIGKVTDLCADAQASIRIHEAVKILSDDSVIYNDKVKAAEAFDSLFVGVGRFCRFLPPPASEWRTFFEAFNLFTPIAKMSERRFNEVDAIR